MIEELKNKNLYNIYKDMDIELFAKFIVNTPEFSKALHNYEQSIVKWQINYMLNGGENWIVDSKYGGEFYIFHENCDYAFRKGITDTLQAIGMDEEAIEEGIETNAEIWREKYIKKAYSNKYNPIFYHSIFNMGDELSPPDKEHEEKWIKMRLYEYYQKHKASVEKYGTVTEEMQMNPQEAKSLREYLKFKDSERMKTLEKYAKISKERKSTMDPKESPKVIKKNKFWNLFKKND